MNSITTSVYLIKWKKQLKKIKNKENPKYNVKRQVKGRGIVIINRSKYTNKCLNILNTEEFLKLDRDLSNPIQAKIQRAVRKIKSHLSNQEYMRIYPTDFRYPSIHSR